MAMILIIEDDKILNRGVAFALQKEGYETLAAYNKEEGKQLILNNEIDLLLLDINLPDGNGLDLCKEIRSNVEFPIVFFTANDTEEDMVKGFEVGCDDYIAKPFSVELLKYKINAILKRNTINKKIYEYKDLKIDFDKMLVLVCDEEINLTATEFKLLELLSKNKEYTMLESVKDYGGNDRVVVCRFQQM